MLSPGDRFCGECGAGVGASRGTTEGVATKDDWRPSPGWKVGVGALAAVLVVALFLRFGTERPQPASAFGQPGAAPGTATGPSAGVLSMTPQQQASALFDRVMRLSEEGKTDSVRFFAPMAIAVYEQLQPLDLDQRFDVGTIGLASGATAVARAQADTILMRDSTHLLGLALASRASRAAGAMPDAERFDARFRQAADGELRKAEQKP